ncbi:MAG: diacylglycerol/lipid kinase family protein [Planctomycetaceae bacterium]
MTSSATLHTGGWVAIQRNRTSGAGQHYEPITALISELRRLGIVPRLFSQRAELDAAISSGRWGAPRAVVAAGGDGTVLDLLNRHPLVPVAILPLGTENLLAREFGIPRRDGRFVARMIAAGRQQTIDLGQIGDLRFAIMASCGFDAAVLQVAHYRRTGHIRHRHYLRPLVDRWWNYRYPPVRVFLDDAAEPIVGSMVVVANLSRYALGLPLVSGARSDDGLLDVRVFSHRSRFQLLTELGNVLLKAFRAGGVTPIRAARVRIEADEPLPIQVDGDPAGQTPVVIDILPQAATLVVPESSKDDSPHL